MRGRGAAREAVRVVREHKVHERAKREREREAGKPSKREAAKQQE